MIGKNIKDSRHAIGISQEKLASILGVARTTVANWERNFSSPDISTIKKLKTIFKCTYDELLDGRNH